jgi:hypothetical protein
MPGNSSDSRPTHPSKRRFVALGLVAAGVFALGLAATLTVVRRQAPQAVESAGEPLTPQEVAEVKAVVEKQTGTPIRYVGPIRQGVVEAFPDVRRGLPAYRVKKTDEGWKVIEMFHAFFA